MKLLATSGFALLLLLTANVAKAEPPKAAAKESSDSLTHHLWQQDLQATPEMWFYLQEKMRREDPQSILRRNAEFRAHQRRQRIAAKKAMGISSSRPSVYGTIFGGHYPRTYPYWSDQYARIWFESEAPRQTESVRR